MEKVSINYNGKVYKYDKNTKYIDIVKDLTDKPFEVLAVFLDNEIFSLEKEIISDGTLTFVTGNDRYGQRIYKKGLVYVLIYAFKELFGYNYHISTSHAIDKAIEIRTDLPLTRDRLKLLADKMKEIVDKDMRISKCLVRTREAIKYFESIGDEVKASTFRYSTNHYVTLHSLGDMYDYFFSELPYSTGYLRNFDLYYKDKKLFILQFPVIGSENKIPDYVDRDIIVEAFNKDYKLSDRLGIHTASDLNKIVARGGISDVIKITEAIASHNLLNVASEIVDRGSIKLVLLAGPSSSGKTTTARKLSMYLKAFGYNAKPLSIDDYVKNRVDTPKLPNGDYDFESINAIDIDLFNDHLKRIIKGEEVEMPTYNFCSGEREYKGNMIKLGEKDILIVEGLHAINEILTSSIGKSKKFKIYVSPLTDLNIDNHNMISNSDLRLLRRIVRDNRMRGFDAESTIKSLNNVTTGEEKYIFPFQGDVDYVYNSSLVYEMGVLKNYVEPLLYGIDKSSKYYEDVVRLINLLHSFVGIMSDEVPSESILREFIGESYFE